MKRLLLMLCFVVQFAMVGCAHPPLAKVTIHAVNQDGKPVTDYQIHASFWGGKEGLKKWPDENGYVTFKSPVLTDAVFSEVSKFDMRHPGVEKYYSTTIRKDYMSPRENVQDGKWQPWNPIIKLVLKERINPIPMYASSGRHKILLPARNEWCGFDMTKNDWVKPYGRGTYADVEIIHLWDGKARASYNGSVLKIRFPDQNAGCYKFNYDYDKYGYSTCYFRSPYHANPSEVYVSELTFSDTLETNLKSDPFDTEKTTTRINCFHIKKGTGYIFRT